MNVILFSVLVILLSYDRCTLVPYPNSGQTHEFIIIPIWADLMLVGMEYT